MTSLRLQDLILSRRGAVGGTGESSGRPSFDNSDRVARALYCLSAYRRMSWHMLRNGVPAGQILRTQMPLSRPDPRAPLMVAVELTNHCDLRCVYCTNPLGTRPRGFMDRETLERVLAGVKQLGVGRLKILGNGEPTLHPEFAPIMRQAAGAAPYVSIVTNGQWADPETVIDALLAGPVLLVEISVDAAGEEGYERSRPGARFDRLVENLRLLDEARSRRRSRTMTNIRLMVRPSERSEERGSMAFWGDYADAAMPQYLVERKGMPYADDLYRPVQFDDRSYPRCSLPFKSLAVNWNGDVPLCCQSARQMGEEPGLILGNVTTSALGELWSGPVMQQYRDGHRERDTTKMAICEGCPGS